MQNIKWILGLVLSILVLGNVAGCSLQNQQREYSFELEEIPAYSGEAYVILENNDPDFSEAELTSDAYELYAELDMLGRCGIAEAHIGEELMPTEEREAIGQVKPSGWHTVKYDNVDGKYLYNRCHLIGFQLTGENANEGNLITGTRYMNVQGMLPFEDLVADYIRETGNHVMYRVTPVFEDDNLVATGVQMEAESVEDNGAGVCFNVFVYNIQPGIEIDYATGESRYVGEPETDADIDEKEEYILNTNSKKYHIPSCSGAKQTKAENKETYVGTAAELENLGYEPCGSCNP